MYDELGLIIKIIKSLFIEGCTSSNTSCGLKIEITLIQTRQTQGRLYPTPKL